MRLATKLDEWRSAGLIDDGIASAILAHEDGRHRPVALFAVAGLGLLALALGILSLLAANWDELPASLKLSTHVVLVAAAAAATWLFHRRDRLWPAEGSLFLLAALTLAGIALQSQVYQQTGALWQALAWWAMLASPAVLLLGRTRLTAWTYGAMLGVLAVTYWTSDPSVLGRNLALAAAPALVLIGLAVPAEARNTTFREALFDMGLAAALLGASLAQIGWAFRVSVGNAWAMRSSLPLAAALVAAACAVAFRRRARDEAQLVAAALGGALLAVLLALGTPHGEGPALRFLGAISFFALWGAVAALAARAGWHRLFRVAVAALAVRLFVIYFELFYSLAFTGVGLIVAGLLLIGLAWGWTRIVRREAR